MRLRPNPARRCALPLLLALPCAVAAASDPNLLQNGTFSHAAGTLGWTNVGSGEADYVLNLDADDSSASGSYALTNTNARSSCFRVAAGAAYRFGAAYLGSNFLGALSDGGMTCHAYASTDCSGSGVALASIDMPVDGHFTTLATGGTLPGDAQSVDCELSDRTTSLPFGLATTWFDNVFFESHAPPQTAITLDGYLSGNWYDTAQAGHGMQLEFTDQAQLLLAIWYVYAPNGGAQTWIFAQGPYDLHSNSVTIPAEVIGDGRFPPQFQSAALTHTAWGTLTFTFTDCDNATVSWNSTLPGYGSGTLPIRRLTHIKGTSCPQ